MQPGRSSKVECPSSFSSDGAALSGWASAITAAMASTSVSCSHVSTFSSMVQWRTHQTWGAVTQTDGYSLTQHSVNDLATPVNLIRGSSLVINGSDYTYMPYMPKRCLLVSNFPPPLGHSLSRCISGTPTHWETGRLGVWFGVFDCVHARRLISDRSVLAGWSILQSIVCRAFAGLRTAGDVRNSRGYVIAEYIISSRRPVLKNRNLTGL